MLNKTGRWIYFYLVSSVIYAIGSFIFAKLFHNNQWFSNIMHLTQFVILSVYYHETIKNTIIKRLIKVILLPAVALFLLDFLKLEGVFAFNSIFATVRTLILMICGILFFFQLLTDEDLVKESVFINTLPDFWFNAGLFVYLCGYFVFSLAFNLFLRHPLGNLDTVQALTFIAGIMELILFYIGLTKAEKRPS
ncbi:hypothetical protein F0L74_08050 [Chitinophaga agrisoli]|uniref:Uncharacterized protein n=1 Tax=Chitinophaga agrisoli TaxID=2607653 RepID=A0A5B2VWB7_9BACT|nr:hypothetical protein [Chitinophaga agrisoli]KAA2242486.1 hypothetical protein F0L74_08050 [Chitinophaga agrisoli]